MSLIQFLVLAREVYRVIQKSGRELDYAVEFLRRVKRGERVLDVAQTLLVAYSGERAVDELLKRTLK